MQTTHTKPGERATKDEVGAHNDTPVLGSKVEGWSKFELNAQRLQII